MKKLTLTIKDSNSPAPKLDGEHIVFIPRTQGIIPPGHAFVIPLNVKKSAKDFLVSLNPASLIKGAMIISGPLMSESEDGECCVAVRNVDPLWEIDLSDIAVRGRLISLSSPESLIIKEPKK